MYSGDSDEHQNNIKCLKVDDSSEIYVWKITTSKKLDTKLPHEYVGIVSEIDDYDSDSNSIELGSDDDIVVSSDSDDSYDYDCDCGSGIIIEFIISLFDDDD